MFVFPVAFSLGLESFYFDGSRLGGVVVLVAVVSVVLLEVLVAPLVGYRRAYALWSFVPFWGWVIGWNIGTRLARLSTTGSWEVGGLTSYTAPREVPRLISPPDTHAAVGNAAGLLGQSATVELDLGRLAKLPEPVARPRVASHAGLVRALLVLDGPPQHDPQGVLICMRSVALELVEIAPPHCRHT